MWQNVRREKIRFAAVGTSASSSVLVEANEEWAIKVLSYAIVASGDCGFQFQSLGSSATDLTGIMYVVGNGGVASPYADPNDGPLFQTNPNEDLVLIVHLVHSPSYVGDHLSYYLENI